MESWQKCGLVVVVVAVPRSWEEEEERVCLAIAVMAIFLCVCVCVCLCIIVGVSDECVPSHLSIFASLCVYFCLEIAFSITITNGSTINTRLEQGASFWRLVRIDERKLLAEANLGR